MNKHDGIAYNVAAAPPDVDSFLYTYYKSGLIRTGHVDSNGQPDAKLDDFLAKQRSEADVSKRATILKDMQRYAAQKQYLLGVPGAPAAWPSRSCCERRRARTPGNHRASSPGTISERVWSHPA